MVSYYNPSTVAMFTGSGRGHYHGHPHGHHAHSPPSQPPYFPGYAPYPPPPQGVGVATHQSAGGLSGVGVPQLTHTQFSPSNIECSTQFPHGHPTAHHPHASFKFDTASADMNMNNWAHAHHQSYSSACAVARAGLAGYSTAEDWSNMHGHVGVGHHVGHHFYHHTQPSPPSSSPSSSPSGVHHHNLHHQQNQASSSSPITTTFSSTSTNSSGNTGSGATPQNNSNNNPPGAAPTPPFKTEFGPCSSTGQQESDLGAVPPQSHSPDSGMAISDGVSSSGSPAVYGQTGQGGGGGQQCLGGPASSGAGSSASSSSASSDLLHHHHHHQGSHGHHNNQYNLHLGGGSMGHTHISQSSPIINVSSGRPTQARSPYEWMKKPSYGSSSTPSSSSNNNGKMDLSKTRTKDKYRVVYSDTQRLELEKEFHYSRYITIRRKSELAVTLGLSERQVKIWFQNRRAKERKIHRKRDEMLGRDKLATMVHMQGGMQVNPMCPSQSIPMM